MDKYCPACQNAYPTWEALREHLNKALNSPDATDYEMHVDIVDMEEWGPWLAQTGEVGPTEEGTA